MSGYIEGVNREQSTLFPERLENLSGKNIIEPSALA